MQGWVQGSSQQPRETFDVIVSGGDRNVNPNVFAGLVAESNGIFPGDTVLCALVVLGGVRRQPPVSPLGGVMAGITVVAGVGIGAGPVHKAQGTEGAQGLDKCSRKDLAGACGIAGLNQMQADDAGVCRTSGRTPGL